MIPKSRAEVTGPLSWFLWAFFGNDDGGLYGERDYFAQFNYEPTLWVGIRWWLRNPMANLMKVVLAWKRDPMRVLVQWSAGDGWRFWHERPQEKWLGTMPQFTLAAIPPGVVWRGFLGTEGYWLWHSDGWFCVLPTIRKNLA